jgi:Zn-dependent alcohol dehydrogenase
VRSVPLAPPGPGEVQVRVSACSVCLTEVHFTDGYYDELDAPAASATSTADSWPQPARP